MSKLIPVEEVNKLVHGWAHNKNLIIGSNWVAQFDKLREEFEELGDACQDYDDYANADSSEELLREVALEAGDILVVLSVILGQKGITLTEAYNAAYNKISKRTGKTINGVFVKDAGQ